MIEKPELNIWKRNDSLFREFFLRITFQEIPTIQISKFSYFCVVSPYYRLYSKWNKIERGMYGRVSSTFSYYYQWL